MTKTICDRCGKDIRGLPHCVRVGIYDNHIADLCRECYKELLDWVDINMKNRNKKQILRRNKWK